MTSESARERLDKKFSSKAEIVRLRPDEVQELFRSISEEESLKAKELRITEGTRAYPLPELEVEDPHTGTLELQPPTVLQAENQLNAILDSVKSQGGRLIGVIPVNIAHQSEPNSNQKSTIIKNFLIIEK